MTEKLAGLVLDLPEHEYHAHPALSSTSARQLLESPAKYHYGLTHPREQIAAFSVGTAVHEKVLGAGSSTRVLDFDDYRSGAARAARDDALAAGLSPVLAKDMVEVDAMAEAVLSHPLGETLLAQEGHPEASVFATDPATGVEVRARFDKLAKIAVDLKTTGKSASKNGFMRSTADFGYEVQQAHYEDAARLAGIDLDGFVFLVVEKTAPYLVAVHQLDREFMEIGRAKAKRAREVFAECTASGVWPGYPNEITLVAPPMWTIYDYQENYE